LSLARPAPSHRPRHRPGRARGAEPGARRRDAAGRRNVLLQRADDRGAGQVRRAAGRSFLHGRARRALVHRAVGEPRRAVQGRRAALMIDHVSLAVGDLARSTTFYEAVLAPLGLAKLVEREGASTGFGKRYPEFWLNARPGLAPQPETKGTHI